jgi:hypothetical protein
MISSLSIKCVLILIGVTFVLSLIVEGYHWYTSKDSQGFSSKRWVFTFLPLLMYQALTIYLWKRFSIVSIEPTTTVPVSTKRHRSSKHERGGYETKKVEEVEQEEEEPYTSEEQKIRTDLPSF